MTIYNLGSINADWFYKVPRFPVEGETLAATDCKSGLGGKGANQSVAAARGGAEVCHIGGVGGESVWAVELMKSAGVDTTHVAINLAAPTGHALIFVEPGGENQIVIFAGTNRMLENGDIKAALARARSGDILMMQNETNGQEYAAKRARDRGLKVVYSAAPFDVDAVRRVLPLVDLLVLNQVEAEQVAEALGCEITNLPVPQLLVTHGAHGATWHDLDSGETLTVPAPKVVPVDTTGAGDTFIGYFCAGLDLGLPVAECLEMAVGAAALKVTREGTAEAIPAREEVHGFLADLKPLA
ncbi:ribokinase [Tropicimonas isoalkanivorans]|uniref:Ribokinase n=1 Tax=Tropicimonas isoalkanivorans TaxID=441112 RepID=A0A1I1M5M2_9RHOB|nr:ribokinase [Tropicimonas isoalkanivorans]SFC80525.1 ribokinase [Tropicimonas isoalkanivorans]